MVVRVLVAIFVLATMVGCGEVRNVTAAVGAFQGLKTTKQFENAEPVLEGIETVRVETEIFPRDEDRAAEMNEAFQANMELKVAEVLYNTHSGLTICQTDCPENTLLIQFRETGWEGWINRMSMRRSFRGDLFFIAQKDGTILERLQVTAENDYRELTGVILAFVAQRSMLSYAMRTQPLVEEGALSEEAVNADMERATAYINEIDPVAREYYDKLDPKNPWYDRWL